MPQISVVIPVYKAEDCLYELHRRLVHAIETITPDFEIIMVEDCGGDRSWEIINQLTEHDQRVKGIQFSRNFGQHYGITAGLDYCNGDWVVVMDCDLQDQPEEIPKLYGKAQEGYDIVLARRAQRQDGFLKTLGSRMFYKVFDYLTDTKTDPAVGTFRILSRKVVKSFLCLKEQLRFFGGMIHWLGFKTAYIDIEHSERYAGRSTYNLTKLIRLAFAAMVSFSDKPLKISINFGFLMFLFSLTYGIFLICRKLIYGVAIEGWTSVMVSIYLIGGLVFLNLGVLGLYIGRIFDETKKRPLYIIRDVKNID